MSYGIQVYQADGQLILDGVTRIPRVIYAGQVAASGSLFLPAYDHAKGAIMPFCNGALSFPRIGWNAATSTLTWNAGGAFYLLAVRFA